MVVLGGIGVWSVTRVLVQQKIKSVAILKCLGASSRQVLAIYVSEVLWLALAGSVLGAGIAAAAVAAIPARVLSPLGITHVAVTASAVAQGVAVGLLVSLFFALVPLLEMRRVKPLLLLRADTAGSARRADAAEPAGHGGHGRGARAGRRVAGRVAAGRRVRVGRTRGGRRWSCSAPAGCCCD